MNKQAIDKILEGVSMTATIQDPGTWKTPSKWLVTITKGSVSHTTTYTMGCAHREWPSPRAVGVYERVPHHTDDIIRLERSRPTKPDLADVIYSLSMDASCVRHGQSLKEFGQEFAYTDLQAGVDAYEGCTQAWRNLIRLGFDLDALAEAFQDY